MTDILQFFTENRTFESLNYQELLQLSEICEIQDYEAQEYIFTTSDKSRFMFVVMEGTVQLNISGSEYAALNSGEIFGEIGVINETIRSGDTLATVSSKLIKISGAKLFDEAFVPASLTLKIVRQMTKKIAQYLVTREEATTQEIINRGEGDAIEFKSTLRMNMHTGQKDVAIENASLKTIAAFINSKGGTLLIGVKDDGEILGLETDRFPNDDKLILHLTNLIKEKIGSLHLKFIHTHILELQGKKVLRVDCRATSEPAYFISGQDEHLYIRTGPSTTSLALSKVHGYISQRFIEVN
ncbi:MAG: putative DNA binding domain-containing protein [Reichenbachiella sp.]